jgi:hypothetical protein
LAIHRAAIEELVVNEPEPAITLTDDTVNTTAAEGATADSTAAAARQRCRVRSICYTTTVATAAAAAATTTTTAAAVDERIACELKL